MNIKLKNQNEEGGEDVGFQDFKKIYRRTIMLYPFGSDSNGLHRIVKKQNLVLNFQTRYLVFVTEQPSFVGVVRVSPFERSVVEPNYTMGF